MKMASPRNTLLVLLVSAGSYCTMTAYAEDVGLVDVQGALHHAQFVPLLMYGVADAEIVPEPERQHGAPEAPQYGAYEVPVEGARFNAYIERAALDYDVDPALIHAIIRAESAYRPAVVSSQGAIGLMQVMPQTALRFGKIDLYDPEQNVRTGTRYLRILQQLFSHELNLVLAAYNAGEHAVIRFGRRIPPYPETQAYVVAVTNFYRRYRQVGVASAQSCIDMLSQRNAPDARALACRR